MAEMKDVRGVAHGLVDVVRDHDHGDVVAEVDGEKVTKLVFQV